MCFGLLALLALNRDGNRPSLQRPRHEPKLNKSTTASLSAFPTASCTTHCHYHLRSRRMTYERPDREATRGNRDHEVLPEFDYHPVIGDEAGSTPVPIGIQTAEPEYVAAVHSHPYMEILHIFDGVAEVMDRQSGRPEGHFAQRQHDRDPGRDAASFRTVGNKVLRLLGAHASPKRIVEYKDGVKTEVRGRRLS